MSDQKVVHAVNEYGDRLVLRSKHPRKELLEELGVKSAKRVYRDKNDGSVVHVGYIAAGSWWTFYVVTPWEVSA